MTLRPPLRQTVAPIVPDDDANVAKFEGGPRLKILIGAWPTLIW